MKKYTGILLAALAVIALSAACNKETSVDGSPAAETVSITATLSDVLTKVDFTPSYTDGKPAGIALTWADTDKLIVADHANPESYSEFELTGGSGTNSAVFSGTPPAGAASYDVSVVHADVTIASQTQPADGDASGLQFIASRKNVTDLTTIDFDETGSVLALTAKMPSTAVAAAVKSVDIKAMQPDGQGGEVAANIFGSGNTLGITITTPGDAGSDGILHLFATLPAGDAAVPAGTTLLVHFNAPGTDHTVYTRFVELGSGLALTAGKCNTVNINATQSATHAGLTSCDGSTAAKAFLIGDKYQLKAVHDLMVNDAKKYFKMVDDVDMTGMTWTHLNKDKVNNVYPKAVDFNGNGKTISYLGKDMFYVLKGSVYDLTLDHTTTSQRGILAEYIQGSGNVVTNVKVTNGSIDYNSTNAGGLIGYINNGTSDDDVTATITDCTVSNTNVKATGVVGGVIGFADAKVIVSGCKYTGGTITSGRYTGGFVGSTGNYASTFTNCQVESAAISAEVTNNDYRVGGFIGQLQKKATVKGCKVVGTLDTPVSLTLSAPASGKVYNAGGFAGVVYGTITKNGDTRCLAVLVTITSGNTDGNAQTNIGGFVGYNTGKIEYSDVSLLRASSLVGSHIGGFVGFALENSVIENCNAGGEIRGTRKTGGFVGVAQDGSFTECETAVFIDNSDGYDIGGFVGEITQTVTLTKCHSDTYQKAVSSVNVGGFAGTISTASGKTTTISRCWSSNSMMGESSQIGGFIGRIAAHSNGTVVIENCYGKCSFDVTDSVVKGGLIGQIDSGVVTVDCCYASGPDVTGLYAVGGLIGLMNSTATITRCAAWSKIVYGSDHDYELSSGAVIGVAWPTATLTDNYRNPSMKLTAWWIPEEGYQHPDVSDFTPLIVKDISEEGVFRAADDESDNYPQHAYHGKCDASKTFLELASTTLGWSSEIWDFSGGPFGWDEFPTLK